MPQSSHIPEDRKLGKADERNPSINRNKEILDRLEDLSLLLNEIFRFCAPHKESWPVDPKSDHQPSTDGHQPAPFPTNVPVEHLGLPIDAVMGLEGKTWADLLEEFADESWG